MFCFWCETILTFHLPCNIFPVVCIPNDIQTKIYKNSAEKLAGGVCSNKTVLDMNKHCEADINVDHHH